LGRAMSGGKQKAPALGQGRGCRGGECSYHSIRVPITLPPHPCWPGAALSRVITPLLSRVLSVTSWP